MSEFNGRRVGGGIRVVNGDSCHGEEDTCVYQEVDQLSYNDEIDGATQNGLREGEDTERAEDEEYFDQQGMDQEMRDLAELQEQWQNRRDLGTSGQLNQHQPGMMDYPPEEENPVMATLLIAQHEWRKVLDGSTGNTTGRPMLPVAEAMSNTYWGDACQDKDSTVFRIYAQNVNGISLDRRGGQYDTLCQAVKEAQADMFLGQEHNLDSTQHQVKSILHDTSKQHWQRYRLTIATTPISFNSMYKPGGTFMLTAGNATGRILSQDHDKWGRWVSQTLQGAAGHTVTVVSAYQVVTDLAKGGTTTATTQQYALLVHHQDSIVAPRTAFRRDLRTFLHQCRNRGDELILIGDFNEAVGEDRNGIVSIIQDLNMTELMGARHDQQLPATYSRGRRCLDYGFATAIASAALKRCGYESFGHRYPSDHRAYFFDFDIRNLFGNAIQALSKFEPRKLYSTNRHQVTAYLRRMDAIMTSCNAYERGDKLDLPGRRDAQAERLDSDILNGSLVSEREVPMFQKPEWSTALANARIRTAVLQKLLTGIKHNKAHSQDLIEQFTQTCEGLPFPQNKTICQKYLTDARSEVNIIVHDSFAQRDQEFRQRIVELEASVKPKDRKHAQTLRQMIQKERRRQMFRKLKVLRDTSGATGVTRIEVPVPPDMDPKACTQWETIDIPSEVLAHLQTRNRRHFGQARETPFTSPPLSDDFGYCGDTIEAQALLEGTYDLTCIDDPSVLLLLNHMQQIQSLVDQNMAPTITIDEFKDKLMVWRESTSTSPSGQHLGHYKALVARHEYSDVTDEDAMEDIARRNELDTIQGKLVRLRLQVINYALRNGYGYSRWKTVANSHILKEPGNVKIHRMRVIHIYEADYNLALGVKWRQVLHKAEEAGALNEGQFGSRPKCMAQEPVLIEELQLELSRVSRKTIAQISYDATSCYDRIPPALAMLISRKFGMAASVTSANARTLEDAQYRIRTDLGLAPTGYSHTPENPIYGTGQGSANSPVFWLLISSVLYDCYDTQAHSATYCTPDRQHMASIGMVGFVDDNNNHTNKFEQDELSVTWREVIEFAAENAQLWTNLLSASGGALELPKCSYHLSHWSFTGSGAPVLTIPDDLPDLVVRDPHEDRDHIIPLLSPYTAHKILGHYKEPSGSQKAQQDHLRKTCADQVAFLWKSPLTRAEAWQFYTSCFIPSVTYPLTNSHFSQVILRKTQCTAMSIIVAKCGYNRHTKREVLYGPLHLGGAGFQELYDHQGIGQITSFIRQWRKSRAIGQLLRTLLAWANYSVGTSVSILADVTTPLPHLEAKWLSSLRDYLRHVRAWIDVDSPGIAPMERENDQYIMEVVLRSNKFKPAQIRVINYCRLYLGAITLADLTTPNGLYLDNAKLNGQVSRFSNVTRWLKIRQDRPADAQWQIWRRANLLWSNRKGRLTNPLGKWLRMNDERRIMCTAYVHQNQVAIRINEEFQTYAYDESSRRIGTAMIGSLRYADIHPNAAPADLYEAPDGIWTLRSISQVVTPTLTPIYNTFSEYIQTLPSWEADLLHHVHLYIDPAYICYDLQVYFYAGSDGSVWNQTQGAFGWMLSNTEGERVAYGKGPARGLKMDSYRAECTGMLSILRFLFRLERFGNMDSGWRGLIGTDSQSMLNTLYEDGIRGDDGAKQLAELDVLDNEWDLLVEIQDTLRELPGVDLTYVKGHQDDRTPYERLPLMAQLNVDADRLAGEFQRECGAQRPFTFMAPNTGALLVTDCGTITSRFKQELINRSTGPGLEEYIRVKNGWDICTFGRVNWEVHGKAVKSFEHKRTHLTKYLHEALPTHHQANTMDGGQRKCVACATCDETTDHIFRCSATSRQAWKEQWWTKIDRFHAEHSTHPLLRYVFCEAMSQWFQMELPDIVSPVTFPADVRSLIQHQNAIGWRQILRGRFAADWQQIQNAYYMKHRRKTKFKRTGERWQKQFIATIWESWFELWSIRNGEVHGTTAESRARAQRREINREVNELFAERAFMEPQVQALLDTDPESQMRRPQRLTKNWLAMAGPVIRNNARRVRRASIQGVRSLRAYFPRQGDG